MRRHADAADAADSCFAAADAADDISPPASMPPMLFISPYLIFFAMLMPLRAFHWRH